MSQIEVKRNFSDYPDVAYPCSKCRPGFLIPQRDTFIVVEPKYSAEAHGHIAWEHDWVTYRFSLTFICSNPSCGETSFASGVGELDIDYESTGEQRFYKYYTIKSFYPAPRLFYLPDRTPAAVSRLISKSFSLYWVDISAASNALRSSLEALLDEFGITREIEKKGKKQPIGLHRRLEMWAGTDPINAELCGALKEIGNLGSHGEVVDEEHFIGLLDIYSFVLSKLFDRGADDLIDLAKKIKNEVKNRPLKTDPGSDFPW